MCILFIAYYPHTGKNGYKLILASNRDELFTRPAKAAHFWDENAEIYGGRDMTPNKEGGTWLAVSEKGRVGILLNLAGVKGDPEKLGRGFLVKDLLECNDTDTFLRQLQIDSDKYNGFHLVSIDLSKPTLGHVNNNEKIITYFPEGCFAFCNSSLKDPYRKATEGQKHIENIVRNSTEKSELVSALFQLLKSDEPYMPDKALEKRNNNVSPRLLTAMSAICVSDRDYSYGTRTHTVILVDSADKMDFYEWNLKQPVGEARECFKSHKEIKLNYVNKVST